MIVIKIEMWPGGDESKAQEFSRAYITNTMDTTVKTEGTHGGYTIKLMGGIWGRPDLVKRVWKRGTVAGFDRVARGVWDLLFLALRNTVGSRNP